MRSRLPLLLLLTVFLCASAAAQSLHERLFPKAGEQAGSAAKVTTHGDYPQQCLQFTWYDSLSRWDTVSQSTFTYTQHGLLAEELRSFYNNGSFNPSYRQLLRYDAQQRLDSAIGMNWNGASWDTTTGNAYDYNANDALTTFWRLSWNGQGWDTTQGYHDEITYHTGNVQASSLESDWQTGVWVPTDSTYFGVDGNMEWDTVIALTFSGIGWTPVEKLVGLTWQDFAAEKPLTGTYQTYNGNTWELYRRFRAHYGPGSMATRVWDTYNAPDWDSTSKEVENYDIHGHATYWHTYVWVGAWLLYDSELNTYTYNGSGNMLVRVREMYDGYLYRYDRRFEYANFFTEAAAPAEPGLQASAYPNPMQVNDEVLHFDLGDAATGKVQAALYDLQGRLRAETFAPAGLGRLDFPVSPSLENGCYIYRVRTAKGEATGRVVLQR